MSYVAAIQMQSSDSLENNLERIAKLVKESVNGGAQLVVLPENAVFIGKNDRDKFIISEYLGKGPIQDFFSKLAKQHKIWLIGGTIPIVSEQDERVFSSCCVWNIHGDLITHYNKIHLFDVNLNSKEHYLESQTVFPGEKIVSVDSPIGKLGLTICYDLRFPELYQALLQKGAELITIPSAFTQTTGQAHWESLLRARAIENFCYIIASNQSGVHANNLKTYGHTMIIDPWGKILGCLEEREGVVLANVDLTYLKNIRRQFHWGNSQCKT